MGVAFGPLPSLIMKRLILTRTAYEPRQTRGVLFVMDSDRVAFQCYTLELAWNNNERGISCIPAGTYPVVFEYSPKFRRKLYELKNVPNRSEVKIHVGNYASGVDRQIEGCILVGSRFVDINHDDIKDIVNSRATLEQLHYHLAGITHTTITIHGEH